MHSADLRAGPLTVVELVPDVVSDTGYSGYCRVGEGPRHCRAERIVGEGAWLGAEAVALDDCGTGPMGIGDYAA
ncbi:hypothetical protein Ari01nite_83550 [Paractinoplanes rishiriensis]|uniref:Uncharacterized protein n=1 Tax=Paractinoplanes rishiriensis TaxID=1050105 RepID=A0A919K4X6_9ACTN|nr:hypothetical protein Ari01nite_83550 [Actinoplanes rishiriensis]